MRKRMTWLLAVCFMLCMCVGAHAEDESVWDFDTEYWTVTGYNGAGGDVTVPDQIQGCDAAVIGTLVFNGDETITSLTLQSNLELIGDGSIAGCSAMTSVTLPESLMVIGANALCNDPLLTELTIPSQVCVIEANSLTYNWALSKVVFTGECPIMGPEVLCSLSDDAVIYVPDDQYDAYVEAFEKNEMPYEVQPSGQNAVPMEPVYDNEDLEIDEDGIIVEYNGYVTRLDIPEEIDGITVRGIGEGVFGMDYYLAYVTLPETLESIGDEAFTWAQELRYVKFPGSLRSIGDRAFQYTYHGSVLELNDGLESIGEEAFDSNSQWGAMVIPEGVKEIKRRAFASNITLTEVYLPSTIESIDEEAFATDWALSYVSIASEKAPQVAADAFKDCGELADIDLYTKCTKQEMLDLQANVDALGLSCRVWRNQNPDVDYIRDEQDTYIENPDGSGSVLMAGYTGDQANIRPWDNYTLSDGNNGATVGIADGALKGNQTVKYFAACYNDEFTYIGNEAFADSALETVDLFDSVTTIGDGAFRNCANLKELTIPESVTSIGSGVFEGCTGLEDVTILCDMSVIPENAFANCSGLKTVKLNAGAVPAGCFENTGLAEVDLNGVTEIGERAFAGTQLASVDLGETVTAVGADAFNGAAVTSLNLGNVITSIGAGAFEGTQISEVEIGNAVTEIGDRAFAGTKLTSVKIPETVASIGAEAFAGDTELKEVALADGVTTIGSGAWNDTAIESFVIPASIAVDTSLIPAVDTRKIRISDAADDDLVAQWNEALAYPWYDHLLRESEQSILKDMPFAANPEADFVIDPDTGMLTEYKGTAVDVVVPRTIGGVEVTGIAYNCFASCRDYTDTGVTTNQTEWVHLRSLVLPETVRTIEDSALNCCQQLETFVCYGILESSGRNIFQQCFNLKNVIFVNPIRQLDNYLFSECRSLETVWYPGTLDRIGISAFENSGIKSVIEDAKVIEDDAFVRCFELTEIHVRPTCETLELGFARNCPKLATICLELTSADQVYYKNGSIGNTDVDTTIILPRELSDEDVKNFFYKFSTGNLGPITEESFITRGDCGKPEDPEMPDVEMLMDFAE